MFFFGLLMACVLGAAPVFAQSGAAAIERTVQLTGIPGAAEPVTLQVRLQAEHASQMDGIVDAAQEALDVYSQWLSPYPGDHLTIVDLPWNSETSADDTRQVLPIGLETRWLVPPETLRPEAQVVRGIGWQWWGRQAGRADDSIIAEGINRYFGNRLLERIFDRRYQTLAHSGFEQRFFGGFIPWTFRDIRLSREIAERQAWTAASGAEARIARVTVALDTLERYLGWPATQRALSAAARHFRGAGISRTELARIFAETSGRDLSWFFEQAFDEARVFDYSVDALSSDLDTGPECDAQPCYRTTVRVRRNGDGLFTGTGLAPVGDYESGRALSIVVAFADGQRITDIWDGRAMSKTLVYHSPARASLAEVDPGRTLMLDVDYNNNSKTLEPVGGRAASKWALKWMVWLQDLLLTYAFFV